MTLKRFRGLVTLTIALRLLLLHACIKAKPVKWGIKVWVCSASVNGYVLSFSIYTGKDPSNPVHEKGLAYGVVMKLIEGYTGKGYTVYTDNYYTSPQLCKGRLEKSTYSSGTVWTNRKHFPYQLCEKSSDPSRGDNTFMYHGDITAVKWLDNKDVCAMSTHISNGLISVKRRCSETNSRIDVSCPEIISGYNQFMGGVDLAGQFICYYSVGRRI